MQNKMQNAFMNSVMLHNYFNNSLVFNISTLCWNANLPHSLWKPQFVGTP